MNSNKDLYTRIDCQSKFTFNIELCEVIQLDRIEIASLELFSSYPKIFQISAADAEKSEWHKIGEFEAKLPTAKSKKQIYEVDDSWRSADHMFKFIKFEMISYQGDEPQCTITWLKVFGFGQFNPRPDDPDDPPDDHEPASDPLKNIVNGIKNIFVEKQAVKEDPTLEPPS